MRPSPLAVPALLVMLSLFAPSHAQAEPHNGGAAIAMWPSGYRVPICVVAEPDSGALVLYEDTRSGSVDVYAQRVDRHGRPLLGVGGALVWTGIGSTLLTSIEPDGSGGAVIAWQQYRGATGLDVLVQRVQADGSLAYASTGLVVCNAAFDQVFPTIVTGNSGSYYVVWTDARANISNQQDIYVQRFNLAGTPQFVANGLLVNTAAFRTHNGNIAVTAPDLLGGALIQWTLSAGGLRAQRVSSTGSLQFTSVGAPLADPTDVFADIAPDGVGGLWAETVRPATSIPYAHHLTATGTSTFAATGIAIYSANVPGFQIYPVRDASGGCFFYGLVESASPEDGTTLFRQQVTSTGTLPRGPLGEDLSYSCNLLTVFDAGSCVVMESFDDDNDIGKSTLRVQKLAFDGTMSYSGMGIAPGRDEGTTSVTAVTATATASGIVMEGHADGRYNRRLNPFDYQAFGQALDSSGNPLWDDAENPAAAVAADAPQDQGGRVRVGWGASSADSPAARINAGYNVWRALGTAPPAIATAVRPLEDVPFSADGRHYVVHGNLYFENVGGFAGSQTPSYALTVATGQDSTAASPATESFMVEAYDDSLHHWWSNVLATHSVDNLPPATPAPFTGQFGAGGAHLHWDPNTDADLAGYRLYRGTSAGFVPGPDNLLAAPADTGWTDAATGPYVYKLSAVDIHGNESKFATLTPGGPLGLGNTPPRALAFTLSSRNPARTGATLQLALPVAGHVRVAIYDASGREVRTLADGEEPVGERALAWDGADATGRAAPSGLYFARLVTTERTLTLRLALTR